MKSLEVTTTNLRRKRVEQTKNQPLFLDPSKNSGRRANHWLKYWRGKYNQNFLGAEITAGANQEHLNCNQLIAGD